MMEENGRPLPRRARVQVSETFVSLNLRRKGHHPSSGDWVEFEPREVLGRSYRDHSLIRKAPPSWDRHRSLGVVPR